MNPRMLLALLERNPTAALAAATALLQLAQLDPSLLSTLLPANSTIPAIVYAKDKPEDAIAFLNDLLGVFRTHPAMFAALAASFAPAPKVG